MTYHFVSEMFLQPFNSHIFGINWSISIEFIAKSSFANIWLIRKSKTESRRLQTHFAWSHDILSYQRVPCSKMRWLECLALTLFPGSLMTNNGVLYSPVSWHTKKKTELTLTSATIFYVSEKDKNINRNI